MNKEQEDMGLSTPQITLWHGDCLDEMKRIPDKSVDMVLADPPYGTTACVWDSIIPLNKHIMVARGRTNTPTPMYENEWILKELSKKTKSYEFCVDEFSENCQLGMWDHLKRIIKPNGVIVMTASQPFTTTLISSNFQDFRQIQVWDKKMPTGHLNAKKKILSRHEDIVIFSGVKFGNFTYHPQMRTGKLRNKTPKRKADNYDDRVYGKVIHRGDNFNDQYYPTTILEISNASQHAKVHPTQKPVPLMEYLIKTYTNEGEVVLDFAMGSGTTGVACKNLNRNFIGIEKDEKYFNIAQERINNS